MASPLLRSREDRPSDWVVRFAGLIPPGPVLDLACGSGRHARLLATLGHLVVAVDRDADALARTAGLGIEAVQCDLEKGRGWPFAQGVFSGIVVTNYLHRPLFAPLLAGLAPDGVLIYETFAVGNAQFGKPSRPDFLLRHGELLDAVSAGAIPDMQIVAFEDGYIRNPRPAVVQRICVRRAKQDSPPPALQLK